MRSRVVLVGCASMIAWLWACDWGTSNGSSSPRILLDGSSLASDDAAPGEDATLVAEASAPDAASTATVDASDVDASAPGDAVAPARDASAPTPPPCDSTDAGDAGLTAPDHVVTNGNDTGAGSLRAAVAASTPGQVIGFAAGVTVVQLASELDIPIPLTIRGPGAALLTIEGGNSAVAVSTSGNPVILSGVTIRHAATAVDAVNGGLQVRDSVLEDNTGAGLAVSPTTNSTVIARVCGTVFADNGVGASAKPIASGAWSAIYLTNSILSGNTIGALSIVSGSGQAAQIILNGGTRVSANTQYGLLVENDQGDAGVGFPSAVAPATGGEGTNVVTANPVGVARLGVVSNADLTFVPLSQVSGNTVDFSPPFP